jgi:membrane carboxypeptidase/penicillin-binding protein PbpC
VKTQKLNNSQQQEINLDTNLFEKKPNNLMDGQKTQKISDRIKHQISTQDFTIQELIDIFDAVSKKLTKSLFETFQNSSKEAKFYSDKVKEITSIFRSFLFRQNSEDSKSVFSIALGNSVQLKLRTLSNNQNYRYWYLDNKNLGRDTEETRAKIESKFKIPLAEIAPDLPPPLSGKKAKITLKKVAV